MDKYAKPKKKKSIFASNKEKETLLNFNFIVSNYRSGIFRIL